MSRYVDEYRDRFGVEPICSIPGVSASAYYQRASGWRSERALQDEQLLVLIHEVWAANDECYGQHRVWRELRRRGVDIGRDRVARLMRQAGIGGAKRRGKPWRTTKADPEAHPRPDLVERDFTAERPNELWVCSTPRSTSRLAQKLGPVRAEPSRSASKERITQRDRGTSRHPGHAREQGRGPEEEAR